MSQRVWHPNRGDRRYTCLYKFKTVQAKKNSVEKVFKILNEKDFSLTSLCLHKQKFLSYELIELDKFYTPDLSEFFVKHCSGLKSLELKNWLNPNPGHNLFKIASRTVSSFHRDYHE